MQKKTISEKVLEIFRQVFSEDTLEISDSTSFEDIKNWDSFNHISLMLSVQEEFNIEFTTEEYGLVKSFGTLCKMIEEKIS